MEYSVSVYAGGRSQRANINVMEIPSLEEALDTASRLMSEVTLLGASEDGAQVAINREQKVLLWATFSVHRGKQDWSVIHFMNRTMFTRSPGHE